MTGLAALVHGLAGRTGVQAVLLLSHDGLPIAPCGPRPRSSPRPSPRWPPRSASTPAGWDKARHRGRSADRRARIHRRPAGAGPRGARRLARVARRGRTPTSARCSTICASIARDSPTLAGTPAASALPTVMSWAVLLAGGSGTRFWPLSTPETPEAAAPAVRLRARPPRRRSSGSSASFRASAFWWSPAPASPRGCASGSTCRRQHPHRAPRGLDGAGAHLGHAGRRSGAIPTPRCSRSTPTGPIGDAAAFRRTADPALRPRAPTTGWSRSAWSRPGPRPATATSCPARRSMRRARTVARFSEKPDAATALDLMAAGALWNSGLFAWTAERLLAEVRAHTPEVAAASPRSQRGDVAGFFAGGHPDLDRRRRARAKRRGGGGARRLRAGTTSAPGRRSPACGPRTRAATWSWARASLHEAHDCIVWSDARSDRAERRAGPRRGAGQRPHPGHAHRAGRRHEAAAGRAPARDPRHRPMTGRPVPVEPRCAGPGLGARSPACGRSAELRAGVWRIRERWEAALDGRHDRHSRRACRGLQRDGRAARRRARSPSPARRSWPIVLRARRARLLTLDPRCAGSRTAGVTVGWIVPAGEQWSGPARARSPRSRSTGIPLRGTYDLVTALERVARRRLRRLPRGALRPACPRAASCSAIPPTSSSSAPSVEPGVVFDVRHGAIVIDDGVEVRHGTRLEGPVYAGPGTRLLGGFIRTSVVRARCRVRGEIASSVFLGYANKSARRLRGPQRASAIGSTSARARRPRT